MKYLDAILDKVSTEHLFYFVLCMAAFFFVWGAVAKVKARPGETTKEG